VKKIKKILGTTALCTALLGVSTGCSLNFDPTTSSDKDDPVVVCTQTDLDTLNQRLTEKQAELDSVNALLEEAENNVSGKEKDIEDLKAERDSLISQISELESLKNYYMDEYNKVNDELQSYKSEDTNVWINKDLDGLYDYKKEVQILDDIILNGTTGNYVFTVSESENEYFVYATATVYPEEFGSALKSSSYVKKYYKNEFDVQASFENEPGDNIITSDSLDFWFQIDHDSSDEVIINNIQIETIRSENGVFDENSNFIDVSVDLYKNINDGINLDDYLTYDGDYVLSISGDITIKYWDDAGNEHLSNRYIYTTASLTYQKGE